MNVTKYFGPLLDPQESRIVNISSSGGPENISRMSEEKRKIIMNHNIYIKQLGEFINEFLDAYAKYDDERGFDLNAYEFSKACVNVYSCFIAPRMEIFKDKNVLINCCNPGLVDTDMAKNYVSDKKKSVIQGIRVPIKLIIENINGKTGTFYGGNNGEEYCLDNYVPVQKEK